jgi:glycerol-3-phosphate dehydrogenase
LNAGGGEQPGQLSPARRRDDIARIGAGQLDVLVVGGGINGAGTALDAVTRGLSVGLVEAQDWASGTSSRSSKLIHGGLRYLEMLDFRLVHEGLRERALLLQRLAPHLVHPVPILWPLHRPVVERAYVGAGIALYDLLGLSTGTGRGLPLHRHLSKRATLAVAPGLRPDGLRGAILYYDAQVDDARYVVDVVRTAAASGAAVANRMAAVGFLREGDRVVGAVLRDEESGAEFQARARSTVIATGAWTEETESLAGRQRAVEVRPSKGVHMVVRREKLALSTGLITRTAQSVLFVLPWGEHWLVGTTDTDWEYSKSRPLATVEDVDYLLAQVNTVAAQPLVRDDVEAVFAGLRPLVAGAGVVRGPGERAGSRPGNQTAHLSREHAIGRPSAGLVVVSGGKFTTYRVVAADAVDAVISDQLPEAAPSKPASSKAASSKAASSKAASSKAASSKAASSKEGGSRTDRVPLLGAEGFAACWDRRDQLSQQQHLQVTEVERLLRRYGSLVGEVLATAGERSALLEPVPGAAGYLGAEVCYAVSHEGARHLDDVLSRRTRVAMETADGGLACAAEVARLLAPLLGWDEAREAAELDDYRRQVTLVKEAAAEAESDEEAAHMASATPSLLPFPTVGER